MVTIDTRQAFFTLLAFKQNVTGEDAYNLFVEIKKIHNNVYIPLDRASTSWLVESGQMFKSGNVYTLPKETREYMTPEFLYSTILSPLDDKLKDDLFKICLDMISQDKLRNA